MLAGVLWSTLLVCVICVQRLCAALAAGMLAGGLGWRLGVAAVSNRLHTAAPAGVLAWLLCRLLITAVVICCWLCSAVLACVLSRGLAGGVLSIAIICI
jgi:hypothetical protein